MERIKAINPKLDTVISAQEAVSLHARVSLGQDYIFYTARGEEQGAEVLATKIISSADGGMQDLFWEYPIFSLPYKSTTIMINDGAPFVVVPEDLFDSAKAEDWLSISTNTEERQILTESISDGRLVVVYSIRKVLFDFCKRSFSTPTFSHNIGTQITYTLRQSRTKTPKLLSAYVDKHFIQIVVTESGELLLANTFRIGAASDCLYYITAAYRQFGLNPYSDPIHLYASSYYEQLHDEISLSIQEVETNHHLTQERKKTHTYSLIHPLELLHILCE